jgi:ribosome recycling factor
MKVRWCTCDRRAEQTYSAVLQEDSMTVADVKKNTEQKMQKSIDTLKADLAKVRTGRAHAGILDHIQVDYYGTPTLINQVANVTLIDARTIGVQPWEKKMIATVEKAIRESDLGLNPSTQGDLIRVPTPALTEERRKEMVKLCKSEAEDAKIAVRNIRRDANEALKKLLKDKAISEDDERRAQDDVQKLTDKFVAEIDKLVAEKEKEVLTV